MDDEARCTDVFFCLDAGSAAQNADNGAAAAAAAPLSSFGAPPDVDREGKNGVQCRQDHFCPIFIPSKARYQISRGTISLLIQDQVPFTVVVQPEEAELYEQLVDRLVEKWWGGTDGTPCLGQHIQQPAQHDSAKLAPSLSSSLEKEEERESASIPSPSTPPAPSTPPSPLPLVMSAPLTARAVRQLVKIESLPLSDQGVSYVRNHILSVLVPAALRNSAAAAAGGSAAGSSAEGWFWVMDDDIQRFNTAKDDKNHAISPRQLFAEVYRRVHEFHGTACDMSDVAIFSLEYSRFAYTYGDTDIALNSYNNIASLFRYDLIPSACSYRFRIREDYDFTLQLILHGLKTARFRNLSFEVPSMAVVPGGMTDYYKTQKEDIRRQNSLFLEAWPAVAQECIKGKGSLMREDMRVRWDLLHPRRNSNPSATLYSRTPLPSRIERRAGVSPADSASASTSTSQGGGRSRKDVLNDGRKGAKKRRRRVGSRSDDDDDDDYDYDYDYEEEEEWEWEWEEKLRSQRQKVAPICEAKKKTRDTECSSTLPGWKGYVLERWRDLSIAEAERLHLRVIPTENLRVGQTVAVVPPLFDQKPSVVEAVLVDKSVLRKRKRTVVEGERGHEVEVVTEWSAVARGMPLLTVARCYEVPAVGVDVAAAAVDAFFKDEDDVSEIECEA